MLWQCECHNWWERRTDDDHRIAHCCWHILCCLWVHCWLEICKHWFLKLMFCNFHFAYQKHLFWICFTLSHFRRLLMTRLRSTRRESLSLKGKKLVNLYLGTLYNCDWRATLKTHKKLHLNCVLLKKIIP